MSIDLSNGVTATAENPSAALVATAEVVGTPMTASAIIVGPLAGITVTNTPTAGQVLVATSGVTAEWRTIGIGGGGGGSLLPATIPFTIGA